eukprot:g835.t1
MDALDGNFQALLAEAAVQDQLATMISSVLAIGAHVTSFPAGGAEDEEGKEGSVDGVGTFCGNAPMSSLPMQRIAGALASYMRVSSTEGFGGEEAAGTLERLLGFPKELLVAIVTGMTEQHFAFRANLDDLCDRLRVNEHISERMMFISQLFYHLALTGEEHNASLADALGALPRNSVTARLLQAVDYVRRVRMRSDTAGEDEELLCRGLCAVLPFFRLSTRDEAVLVAFVQALSGSAFGAKRISYHLGVPHETEIVFCQLLAMTTMTSRLELSKAISTLAQVFVRQVEDFVNENNTETHCVEYELAVNEGFPNPGRFGLEEHLRRKGKSNSDKVLMPGAPGYFAQSIAAGMRSVAAKRATHALRWFEKYYTDGGADIYERVHGEPVGHGAKAFVTEEPVEERCIDEDSKPFMLTMLELSLAQWRQMELADEIIAHKDTESPQYYQRRREKRNLSQAQDSTPGVHDLLLRVVCGDQTAAESVLERSYRLATRHSENKLPPEVTDAIRKAGALIALSSVEFTTGLHVLAGHNAELVEMARLSALEMEMLIEPNLDLVASLLDVSSAKFGLFGDIIFKGGESCGRKLLHAEGLLVLNHPRAEVAALRRHMEEATELDNTLRDAQEWIVDASREAIRATLQGLPENKREEGEHAGDGPVAGVGVAASVVSAATMKQRMANIERSLWATLEHVPRILGHEDKVCSINDRREIISAVRALFGGRKANGFHLVAEALRHEAAAAQHHLLPQHYPGVEAIRNKIAACDSVSRTLNAVQESVRSLNGILSLGLPPSQHPLDTDWLLFFLVASPRERQLMKTDRAKALPGTNVKAAEQRLEDWPWCSFRDTTKVKFRALKESCRIASVVKGMLEGQEKTVQKFFQCLESIREARGGNAAPPSAMQPLAAMLDMTGEELSLFDASGRFDVKSLKDVVRNCLGSRLGPQSVDFIALMFGLDRGMESSVQRIRDHLTETMASSDETRIPGAAASIGNIVEGIADLLRITFSLELDDFIDSFRRLVFAATSEGCCCNPQTLRRRVELDRSKVTAEKWLQLATPWNVYGDKYKAAADNDAAAALVGGAVGSAAGGGDVRGGTQNDFDNVSSEQEWSDIHDALVKWSKNEAKLKASTGAPLESTQPVTDHERRRLLQRIKGLLKAQFARPRALAEKAGRSVGEILRGLRTIRCAQPGEDGQDVQDAVTTVISSIRLLLCVAEDGLASGPPMDTRATEEIGSMTVDTIGLLVQPPNVTDQQVSVAEGTLVYSLVRLIKGDPAALGCGCSYEALVTDPLCTALSIESLEKSNILSEMLLLCHGKKREKQQLRPLSQALGISRDELFRFVRMQQGDADAARQFAMLTLKLKPAAAAIFWREDIVRGKEKSLAFNPKRPGEVLKAAISLNEKALVRLAQLVFPKSAFCRGEGVEDLVCLALGSRTDCYDGVRYSKKFLESRVGANKLWKSKDESRRLLLSTEAAAMLDIDQFWQGLDLPDRDYLVDPAGKRQELERWRQVASELADLGADLPTDPNELSSLLLSEADGVDEDYDGVISKSIRGHVGLAGGGDWGSSSKIVKALVGGLFLREFEEPGEDLFSRNQDWELDGSFHAGLSNCIRVLIELLENLPYSADFDKAQDERVLTSMLIITERLSSITESPLPDAYMKLVRADKAEAVASGQTCGSFEQAIDSVQ